MHPIPPFSLRNLHPLCNTSSSPPPSPAPPPPPFPRCGSPPSPTAPRWSRWWWAGCMGWSWPSWCWPRLWRTSAREGDVGRVRCNGGVMGVWCCVIMGVCGGGVEVPPTPDSPPPSIPHPPYSPFPPLPPSSSHPSLQLRGAPPPCGGGGGRHPHPVPAAGRAGGWWVSWWPQPLCWLGMVWSTSPCARAHTSTLFPLLPF